MFKLSPRLQELAKRISELEWPSILDDFTLEEEDFFNLNIGHRGSDLFLGYFSNRGLEIILQKYKIFPKLNAMGFNNVSLELDTSDAYKHKLMLINKDGHKNERLVEIVAKREQVIIDMPFDTPLNGKRYEMLVIEWLKMQNPRRTFTGKRPQLPGQEFPGLGIGSRALELFIVATKRLGLQGIINKPDHYHNAFFYSKFFYYENPLEQAQLLALIRDTKKYNLPEVAWAIENKNLIDLNIEKPFIWHGTRQVLPIDKKLAELFASRAYRTETKKYVNDFAYKLKK